MGSRSTRAAPPGAPRQQLNRVPYMPGLDGLRALAVIAVVLYHANHEWLSGGFLGVEVFFVISGYLITLLLIGEHERSGRVGLRRFWLRRARRLLPALLVMMGGLAVYMALFARRPMGQARGDFVSGLFYGANWYQIWVGQSYTAGEAFAPLRHLWSLGVEEQFYLLWPLVMLVLLRRGRERLPRLGLWLFGLSLVIALATAVLFAGGVIAADSDPLTGRLLCGPGQANGYWLLHGRCVNVDEALYLGTFSRAGGLMLGAGFAMLWRPAAVMRGPMRHRGRRIDLVALVGLACLAMLMSSLQLNVLTSLGPGYDARLFRGGILLTGLCTVMVIAATTHRRSIVGRLLGLRPLNWVGTRSYGLYLYHWPIYQIIRQQAGVPLTAGQFAIAMLIALPVTELSYRFVETPIRQGRLGSWLRSHGRPRSVAAAHRRRQGVVVAAAVAVLGGFATVSIATADVQCVGQQECDNETARSELLRVMLENETSTTTTAPPPTQAPTTSAAATVPGDTTAPTAATTTTVPPPPPPPPPYAVGESVMLGALPQLQAGGIVVNAAVSRQGKNVAEILELVRAAGQLGPVVIIQTGTNGSISDETLDRMMAALPPDLTPLVVFLTAKAPKPWIGDNNIRIRQLPARYPNVKVLDWEVAAQQIAGELSSSDGGVHLATRNAKQFYANLVFDAIGRPDLKK